MYKKALIFATKKHKDQKRRNGSPYLIHLIRVADEVETASQKVIALLHDTLEDTNTTQTEILAKFGANIYVAIEALTHRDGESYKDYIQRVKVFPDAIRVKIADIADNLADSPSEHAIKKSAFALDELLNK